MFDPTNLIKVWDLLEAATGTTWSFVDRRFQNGDDTVSWTQDGWQWDNGTDTLILQREEDFDLLRNPTPGVNPGVEEGEIFRWTSCGSVIKLVNPSPEPGTLERGRG